MNGLHRRSRAIVLGVISWWIGFGVFVGPGSLQAHAFAPALLELQESADGTVAVRFKQPSVRAVGSSLQPILPADCEAVDSPSVAQEGTGLVSTWTVRCAEGLVGRQVGMAGIAASGAEVLLRVEPADGRSIRRVLSLDRPVLTVPDKESVWALGASYGELGVEHILSGFDHLLFVFGLVLLVGGGRRLFWTVTAFTAGHSVTLAAAALGWIFLPQAPVEVAIAFSIYILAVELTRQDRQQRAARASYLMASGFGLLHGLGFAGALREAGLPQHDVPAALFAFNLGIELGQLAFVLTVLALAGIIRLAVSRGSAVLSTEAGRVTSGLPSLARTVSVYGLGTLSVFWFCERLAGIWPLA